MEEISFKLGAVFFYKLWKMILSLIRNNNVYNVMDKKLVVLLILFMGLAAIVTLSVNALTSNLPVTERLVTTIRTNSSIPSAYDSNGQISCNDGETLTGGGYKSTFKDGLSVYQNGPSADGKKWLVSARSTPGSAAGGSHRGPPPPLEIYGICMKILS